LLRPDSFGVVVVVGDRYAEYTDLSNIMPVATLSIPIASTAIESSVIMITASTIGNPSTIKIADKMSDSAPPIIYRTRNHAGGLLLLAIVYVIDWIVLY
jgi:hypothetical protein